MDIFRRGKNSFLLQALKMYQLYKTPLMIERSWGQISVDQGIFNFQLLFILIKTAILSDSFVDK